MKTELKAIAHGAAMILTPLIFLTLTLYFKNPYLKMATFTLWCVVTVIVMLWILGRGKAFKSRNNEIYKAAYINRPTGKEVNYERF